MKATRLSRALLKPSTAPLPFLLPAFATSAQTSSASNVSNTISRNRALNIRAFSTSKPGEADQGTSEASAQNESQSSESTSRAVPPFSGRAVSSQLGNIIGPNTRRKPASSWASSSLAGGRGPEYQQRMLADEMGLKESNERSEDYVVRGNYSNIMPPPLPVRLDAFVGRSESVTRLRGFSQAMRALDMKCAVNKVKSDFHSQKFHERPGLKRKRLRSLRWRRRFKEGFQATVSKVIRMRDMGW